MITDFYIGQGDTSPALLLDLWDEFGNPITKVLPASTTQYSFHMMTDAGVIVTNDGRGVLVSQTLKQVGYTWQTADTANYTTKTAPNLAEMQITFDDGTIGSFPNDGYLKVHIRKQVV